MWIFLLLAVNTSLLIFDLKHILDWALFFLTEVVQYIFLIRFDFHSFNTVYQGNGINGFVALSTNFCGVVLLSIQHNKWIVIVVFIQKHTVIIISFSNNPYSIDVQ